MTLVNRTLTETLALDWKCADLMEKHGLTARGWKFEHHNAKRQYGLCHYGKRTIFLSKHLLPLMTEQAVIDTMLHEIAHALVGGGHGHGPVWRNKCLEIGAKPNRTSCMTKKLEGGAETARAFTSTWKYTLTCPTCKTTVPKNRKPKSRCSCSKCCPRFNEKHVFVLTQNY